MAMMTNLCEERHLPLQSRRVQASAEVFVDYAQPGRPEMIRPLHWHFRLNPTRVHSVEVHLLWPTYFYQCQDGQGRQLSIH
jgi:hypothetical protein